MTNPDTVSFMSAQITIAKWYLDRAARASGDASIHYVQYTRHACDIVSQLLAEEDLDEVSVRVQRDLAVLRERLRSVEKGHNGLDARRSRALLADSSAIETES